MEANLVGDEGRQIDHGWMMVHSVGVGKLVSRQGFVSKCRHHLHPMGNGV